MSDVDISFEAWVETLRRSLTDLASEMTEPDDDWPPFCLVSDRQTDTFIDLPLAAFHPIHKQILFAVLPGIMRRAGAVRVAMVTSMWEVTGPPAPANWDALSLEERERAAEAARAAMPESLEDHPDRKEAVMLNAGDVDHVQSWHAPIERFPDRPPRLGAWVLMQGAEGALREVVRRAVADD